MLQGSDLNSSLIVAAKSIQSGIPKELRIGRPVVIVVLFSLLAQAATTFDLSADFSLRNNPNQVWQYGYSETNSLDPAQFRIDKSTGTLGPGGRRGRFGWAVFLFLWHCSERIITFR
jgi:hypothetical protein